MGSLVFQQSPLNGQPTCNCLYHYTLQICVHVLKAHALPAIAVMKHKRVCI